jgi:hypothetical protein
MEKVIDKERAFESLVAEIEPLESLEAAYWTEFFTGVGVGMAGVGLVMGGIGIGLAIT